MKKIIMVFFALVAVTMWSCGGNAGQNAETDSLANDSSDSSGVEQLAMEIDTIAEDWDEDDKPMPMYVVNKYDNNYNIVGASLRFIYGGDDDKKYYLPRAKNYTTLISNSKAVSISYKNEQKGREMGSVIEGEYSSEMSGLNYTCNGRPVSGYAFTDNYMKTHENIELKYPRSDAPKSVIQTLEERYKQKVLTSVNCATSADGKVGIYSVQMRPKNNRCLGLKVVRVDNEIYTYEEWAENYDEGSAWHVDDGGDYPTYMICAVTKGKKGYNIFYSESAPESSNEEMLMLRNGELKYYRFEQYYNYIDYYPGE